MTTSSTERGSTTRTWSRVGAPQARSHPTRWMRGPVGRSEGQPPGRAPWSGMTCAHQGAPEHAESRAHGSVAVTLKPASPSSCAKRAPPGMTTDRHGVMTTSPSPGRARSGGRPAASRAGCPRPGRRRSAPARGAPPRRPASAPVRAGRGSRPAGRGCSRPWPGPMLQEESGTLQQVGDGIVAGTRHTQSAHSEHPGGGSQCLVGHIEGFGEDRPRRVGDGKEEAARQVREHRVGAEGDIEFGNERPQLGSTGRGEDVPARSWVDEGRSPVASARTMTSPRGAGRAGRGPGDWCGRSRPASARRSPCRSPAVPQGSTRAPTRRGCGADDRPVLGHERREQTGQRSAPRRVEVTPGSIRARSLGSPSAVGCRAAVVDGTRCKTGTVPPL